MNMVTPDVHETIRCGSGRGLVSLNIGQVAMLLHVRKCKPSMEFKQAHVDIHAITDNEPLADHYSKFNPDK